METERMPDDQVVEEVAEHADEEALFDEVYSEKSETPVVGEKAPPEKTEEAEAGDKTQEKTEEAMEPSAKDRAEQRLKELGLSDEQEKQPDPPPAKVEEKKPEPPIQTGKKALTKELVADYLSLMQDVELPDGDIIIGNDTVNLKQFSQDLPEYANAMKVLGAIMAERMAERMLSGKRLVSEDRYRESMAQTQSQIATLAFWNDVLQEHPDAKKLVASKDFQDWSAKQSRGIQTLANSPYADDGILVLNLYKEEQARAKAKEFDEQAKTKKKRTDDLHSETMRGKQTMTKKADSDDADEEKLFNELYQRTS